MARIDHAVREVPAIPPLRLTGLTPPKRIDNWSLTSLQQRLMKTGGRLGQNVSFIVGLKALLLLASVFYAFAVLCGLLGERSNGTA